MSNAAPGWYPDTNNPGQQRYWDGNQWTEHVAPMAPAAPQPGGYGVPTAPTISYAAYGAPQPGGVYAHWGQRVGAALIDGLCLVPFYIVGFVALSTGTSTDNFSGESTTSSGAMLVVGFAYLCGIAFAIWNQSIRQGSTGYSIGKQVLGIKLIKEETGQPL